MAKVDGFSEEELTYIVKESKSKKEVAQRLGYRQSGSVWKVIVKRLDNYGIDWEHLLEARRVSYRKVYNDPVPLEEVLVENSTYRRQSIRVRLIEEGYIEDKCETCGVGDEWNGKELTLHLDHINGVNDDNRIENLRLLCPNCHSQTDTYAGRNSRMDLSPYIKNEVFSKIKEDFLNPKLTTKEVLDRNNLTQHLLNRIMEYKGMSHRRSDYEVWVKTKRPNKNKFKKETEGLRITDRTCGKVLKYPYKKCEDCDKYILKRNKRCGGCHEVSNRKTKEIPPKNELLIMIASSSFESVGRNYGVTGNAVRKWCDSYKLPRTKNEIVKLNKLIHGGYG